MKNIDNSSEIILVNKIGYIPSLDGLELLQYF